MKKYSSTIVRRSFSEKFPLFTQRKFSTVQNILFMPKRRRTRREQDTALYVAFSHSAIEILRLVYQDIGEIEPLDEQKVNTTLKKTLRRSVDFVLLFTIKGQKKLIHIEFQLTDQSEFYYRNFLY
ncbi:MAG: hypothetical protein RMJ89_10855, partial [Flammeovirgaceae bacterium]|nr:hypothetical protein [Flammeovirgaceae bacterium]